MPLDLVYRVAILLSHALHITRRWENTVDMTQWQDAERKHRIAVARAREQMWAAAIHVLSFAENGQPVPPAAVRRLRDAVDADTDAMKFAAYGETA